MAVKEIKNKKLKTQIKNQNIKKVEININ